MIIKLSSEHLFVLELRPLSLWSPDPLYVEQGVILKEYNVQYSRKIWRGIKFGSLAICLCNCQIKICQFFMLTYIRMAIPYQTAKFNSCQYFQLYGNGHIYCNATKGLR